MTCEEARAAIRSRQPLLHCISNIVTANDCANLALAVGASPIMAQAPQEMAEIAALAAAVMTRRQGGHYHRCTYHTKDQQACQHLFHIKDLPFQTGVLPFYLPIRPKGLRPFKTEKIFPGLERTSRPKKNVRITLLFS